MSPFDWIKKVNEKNGNSFDEGHSYNAFIINRGLSFHQQTIHFANYLNEFNQLDKDLQFDFLYNIIPKGKRYYKWEKKEILDENVELFMEFYGVNRVKAMEYLDLLPEHEIETIKNKMNKGGKYAK